MTTPTKRPAKKSAPVKTTIRLAPEAHAELLAAAESNGRTMNAELLARIHGGQVATLRSEVAELKAMIRELLDLTRDKL